jgi:hypothetical protein
MEEVDQAPGADVVVMAVVAIGTMVEIMEADTTPAHGSNRTKDGEVCSRTPSPSAPVCSHSLSFETGVGYQYY